MQYVSPFNQPFRTSPQTSRSCTSACCRPDFAAVPQVADHIPVDGGFVLAARLRVAGAQRHVEAAADLLVEQDFPRELLDALIRADGELTDKLRPESVASVFFRKSWFLSAVALTTLPFSNQSCTPVTSRPL